VRWMRWALTIAVVAVWWALPGSAFALVLAPPGHPGANQYFETIPTSAGQAAPPGSVHGSGSNSAGSGALAGLGRGRSTDAKLAKLGTEGQAAAALVASTAPVPAHGPAAAGARATEAAGTDSGSISSGLSHALTSSSAGGLGVALPLLLLTALVLALGIVGTLLLRHRSPSRAAN
jgi:hypothetical protein